MHFMADARARVPRAPRVVISIALQHSDAKAVASDQAEDVSTSGLFVRCEEPYTVGTAVSLRMDIPGTEVPLEALGCVVRVGSGGSGHTGMGIMFMDLAAESRAVLERLLAAAPEQRRK
jgi:uncharacterized protein (TIGR02266 family)